MMFAAPGIDRVLLVGFMGSGKTTVGRLLADGLGWVFADFDEKIEARLGRTIASVFEDEGESFFRQREAEVGVALLSEEGVVLASGGGWPAHPGNWATVPGGTLSVWLEVGVETLEMRLRDELSIRPLLAKNDPFGQARTLLCERRAAYERADCRVVTDSKTPRQVADEIEALVRNRSHMNQRSDRMSN